MAEINHFITINLENAAYIRERYQANGNPEIRFKTWWMAFAGFYNERPFDLIYMDQISNSELYEIVGRDPSSAFYSETRKILEDGQREGVIKPLELSLLNQFVRNAIVNVMKLNVSKGISLSQPQIDNLVSMCWDAVSIRPVH
jgi:hypothetical protein